MQFNIILFVGLQNRLRRRKKWSFRAQVSCGCHGKVSDLHSQCCWVGFPFFCFKTAFCCPNQCRPVNSSLRLQLVATCFHLSICYIGLGALSKLLKVTICFVISVSPSVRRKQIVFHYRNFCEIQYLKIFPIYVDVRQFSIKSDKNSGYITLRPMYICVKISLNSF